MQNFNLSDGAIFAIANGQADLQGATLQYVGALRVCAVNHMSFCVQTIAVLLQQTLLLGTPPSRLSSCVPCLFQSSRSFHTRFNFIIVRLCALRTQVHPDPERAGGPVPDRAERWPSRVEYGHRDAAQPPHHRRPASRELDHRASG